MNSTADRSNQGRVAGTRLLSLDAFRGATILLMCVVNNAGGPESYSQLQHSLWNGWTATDAIFPSFIWIVGVAIALSLGNKREQGIQKWPLVPKIIRRSTILFVLGMLVYVYPTLSLSHQRVLGVLQRIAICYLVASLIYLYASMRAQILWVAALLVVYWLMMMYANVPGYGHGRLDMEGNFAHYIDRIFLGTHNYEQTQTWDPEGIVSTLPAIATALLGALVGHSLRSRIDLASRRNRVLLVGAALLTAGLICSLWMPINKKLWTDSFTLFMAGLDCLILALFVWLVDERGNRKIFRPFLVTGANAITIYLASEFFSEFLDGVRLRSGADWESLREAAYVHVFSKVASPLNASLLSACAFTAIMYLLAYVMYKRNWFIRI